MYVTTVYYCSLLSNNVSVASGFSINYIVEKLKDIVLVWEKPLFSNNFKLYVLCILSVILQKWSSVNLNN